MRVVDASVAGRCYFPESGSGEAQALFEAGGLIAPDFLSAEFMGAASRRARNGGISREYAVWAMAHMQRQIVRFFPDYPLLGPAFDISLSLDHPPYDCVYLALAVRENVELATADEDFLRKAARSRWRDYVVRRRRRSREFSPLASPPQA